MTAYALIGSAIPWIGGPVSNVIGGLSASRKFERIKEVLVGITEELCEFKSVTSESYVQTEDFEDLLEQSLRRVADERNLEKRIIYKKFIVDAIEHPGESYDEQLRFVRILEEIQLDHLKVMKALSEDPITPANMLTGSPFQTLNRRLPEMDEARIEDIINQLNDLRLTNLNSLKTMMTPQGAEDLTHSVNSLGKRFVNYLLTA